MTQPQAPVWQTVLEKQAPALSKEVTSVRQSILTDGALSLKVKTLMTMPCDVMLAHPDGAAAIAGRARATGASEAEIAETVSVAFLMDGLPALVTGTRAFNE